jgi:hypothetical protein
VTQVQDISFLRHKEITDALGEVADRMDAFVERYTDHDRDEWTHEEAETLEEAKTVTKGLRDGAQAMLIREAPVEPIEQALTNIRLFLARYGA